MTDPVNVANSVLDLQIAAPDGALTVQCRGKLTAESSDFFKREVKGRIPEKGRMVIDLSDVSRMDSSGLGAIVGLYLSARGRSCDFDLINMNKQIRDLFAISRLLEVFETCGRQGIRMP